MNGNQPTSINDIYQAIVDLDPAKEFQTISYNLTSNNALTQASPWWVFIPFGKWSTPPVTPVPSPLENAFLQVIRHADSDKCFIDISLLSNIKTQFCDDKTPHVTTIAQALADFINNLPPDVTPVVRYLMGRGIMPLKDSLAQDGLLQTLFAPGKNLVRNQKAEIYFGSFTPGLLVPKTLPPEGARTLDAAVISVWEWILAEILKFSVELFEAIFKELGSKIFLWISEFLKHLNDSSTGQETDLSGSWNHSKIFAINGKQLVTGGANYWGAYATGQDGIFDLSMTITGDTTADSHKFLDCMWQYLANIPESDTASFSVGNKLADPITNFAPATAPLSPGFSKHEGGIPALSVGKNGLWETFDTTVPVTLFDSVRDFLLNVLDTFVEARFHTRPDYTVFVTNLLSDDNPTFRDFMNDTGVNPTGWASRYARNYVIREARESVKFSQQKFVMNDLEDSSHGYQELVHDINKTIGHGSSWDGFIWPYDTLSALGTALSNMSNSTNSPAGVQIVASNLNTTEAGYNDAVSSADFKNKLKGFMRGMLDLKVIEPNGDIGQIVDNLLVYKRISDGTTGNHSKLVMADDAICYIGSDNAYPAYNQEFGVWIDDEASIQRFIQEFWDPLYAFAVSNSDGQADFEPADKGPASSPGRGCLFGLLSAPGVLLKQALKPRSKR